jgi:rhamnose utilization protein RhaD (predicted bifunctional aldolase and dehydrogenase)|tara:strand:+ start:517 stop:807 length:291 start_codon:yes stop_codon:yes gene_type:complete
MSVFKKIRSAIGKSQREKSYLKSYQNYMETIDRLESKKMSFRGARMPIATGSGLFTRPNRPTLSDVREAKLSDILDKHRSRALALAQAKYYAKQVG